MIPLQVDDTHDAVCGHARTSISDICAGIVAKYKVPTSTQCRI